MLRISHFDQRIILYFTIQSELDGISTYFHCQPLFYLILGVYMVVKHYIHTDTVGSHE